jgi:predicted ATPase
MTTFNLNSPTHFVSRNNELSLLQETWNEVEEENKPKFVFLMGEPGIGKSTLCHQFLTQLERQNKRLIIASARCDSYSGGYDVIRDIFWQFFEKGEGMGLTRKELVQAIIQQAPIWFSMLSGFPEFSFLIAIAQSMKIAYEHILKKNQLFEQASVNNQFIRFIGTVNRLRDIVIFIDDLHNADNSTLSLIESLSYSLNDGSILFVFASRYTSQISDPKPDNVYNEKFKQVIANCISHGVKKIDILNGIDITQYIQERFPGLKLSQHTIAQLVEKTEGHPLFLEKLLSLWEQERVIIKTNRASDIPEWTLTKSGNEIHIPDALSGLIESQFSSLAMDLRHLLQVASVEGENFTVQVISKVLSEQALKIVQKIQVVEDEYRLVKPYQSLRYGKVVFDFYAFFHGFIHEYIYTYKLDSISKRQLHSSIGDIMEQLYAGKEVASVSSQLARHFHEGMNYEKAVQYYLKAAEYEQSQYAWDASQEMCEEGILITHLMNDQVNTPLVALLETSALGYYGFGNYEKVIEQYEKAIIQAIKVKDAPEHIAMMCQRVSDYLDSQGQLSKAREYVDLGFQVLGDHSKDILLRLWLTAREARILSHQKDMGQKAVKSLKSVIEQAEKMPPSTSRDILLYETYNYLGTELNAISAFEEMEFAYRRSAEIALNVGMDQDARTAKQNLAFAFVDQGRFQESLEIAQQCLQAGLDAGMLEDQAYSYTIMGAAYASLGEYATAIEVLKKGISMFEYLGNRWNDAYSYYDLTRAYLGAGDVSAAYAAAKSCLRAALIAGSDDVDTYDQGFAYEALGRSLAEMGDWANAEENFKKAIKVMREGESFFEEARAQKFYGLALIKRGEIEKGIKLLKISLSKMKKLKIKYQVDVIRDILSQLTG